MNGRAEISDNRRAYGEIWPLALRYVRVTVEQVYPDCKARIPRMSCAPLSDAFFHE